MHKIVLFGNPVISNGMTLFGRLYSGLTQREILTKAGTDYRILTVREAWEGKEGQEFREQEGWTLIYNEDGTVSWWSYDETKYTYDLGFSPIPDEFVQLCNPFARHIALISGWVPLKMADCNDEDYIVNGTFYYMVTNANPNDLQWTNVEEQEVDDLPF